MPLPQSYTKGVLFVGRQQPGMPHKITATGFLIGMETPVMHHCYVVTAAHVIEGTDELFVRIRMKDGSFVDQLQDGWVPNGTHDVAIAPIDLPDGHDLIATGLDQFMDRPDAWGRYGEIEYGDVVYFIGLLGKVKAMTARNVPLVRTGFLGALKQENVPVCRPGEATKWITAHLIDCRSFSGFSGSPCYLQKPRVCVGRNEAGSTTVGFEYRTLLLGLMGGHFDDWAKTRSRDIPDADEDDAEEDDDAYVTDDHTKSQVSTGVGYVIPVEFIRETLMKPELEEDRARREQEAEMDAQREDARNAATEDAIQDEGLEYARFEDLAKKIVQVPKSELGADKRAEDDVPE